MRVSLLGPLEIHDDGGRPIAVHGARQRTLVALLALNARRVVSSDQLVVDLWPTAMPKQPTNTLQIVVSKARRALGAEVIETRPPGYSLAVAPADVDVHRFEGLVDEGRAAVADGALDCALRCFDAALGLWRGDALAEFRDVQPAVFAAARLDELRASTIEDRFDVLLALGRDAVLVADLETAITDLPYRERLRGQHLLALYRSGRQAEALRAARDARRVLAEELGLEPGNELRRLEAAMLQHDEALELGGPRRVEPVRPAAPAGIPTNLRPPLTSFVGREDELAIVGELVAEHRLVTLVGAGGCGKTRLANEFASRATGQFRDGVWLASLETVTSGDAVATTVATAVGLSTADTIGQAAATGTGSAERLCAMLADRTALVVIDNCEHVIDDAARLALEVLAAAPHVRMIATSREALRIPGEVVWRVPPLGSDDCVTLFAERARSASATFELRASDRGVIAEVCARVDGMPLAIELAAARTSAFTVGQVADRLDDRFRVLTGGARTALPRHQTLRAVTDWSYDLLFDEERTVFERLAVFSGGCTLEAAEDVCADHDLPSAEVGALVGRLVDKSLVVADGSGRFRLLLSLADYGRERLGGRQDAAAVRDRHAAHHAGLAERSLAEWRMPTGHTRVWWLNCLTTELDNLRAALAWSITQEDAVTAQLLAGHLGWYWWHSGRAGEGHRWLEGALGCRGSTPPEIRGRALTWAALLALQTGDLAAAEVRVVEAIDAVQRGGDRSLLGTALFVSAQLATLDGDLERAETFLDQAQQAHESMDDPWHEGIAAMQRALLAERRGQISIAEDEAVAAIDRLRSVGDMCTLVPMLTQYSRLLQSSGRFEDAESAVSEARAVSESSGLRGWTSATSARLGELAMLRGDDALAAEHYRTAVELARELALPAAEAEARAGLRRAVAALSEASR